jgi:hypothetical protein
LIDALFPDLRFGYRKLTFSVGFMVDHINSKPTGNLKEPVGFSIGSMHNAQGYYHFSATATTAAARVDLPCLVTFLKEPDHLALVLTNYT